MTSPEGDHAAHSLSEVAVREIKAQTRIFRSQLEQRLGNRIDEKHPLISAPEQRRCGKTWKRPVVEFGGSVHFRPACESHALRGGEETMLRGVHVGHHERSGAAIFLTPDGVRQGTKNCENVGAWDLVRSATCIGQNSLSW